MTREEAIEKVRKMSLPKETVEILEALAPELKDSEDERMRKEIIEYLKLVDKGECDYAHPMISNWITWLEKQKELFESGRGLYYYDGEKTTYCGYPATEENSYDFAMSQQEKPKVATATLDSKEQKEQKHPNGCFTCDEYKKGYEEGRRNGFTAGYNKAMKEIEQKEQKPWKVGANAYFTPEQKPSCWDSPVMTNEMIMGEQKPVEIHIDNPNIQKFDPDVKVTTSDSLASGKELLYVCNKSYKIGYRDGVASVKPAEWNANDKAFIKDCAHILNENGYEASAERLLSMFPVKPAEWSEEDEKILDSLIRLYSIEYSEYVCPWANGDITYGDVVNFLKSLRPQSKEELAKMLQDEYNKGKEIGEREGHTKGYNKGYKDAEKVYNESVSYHFPVMPTTPSGWGCDGTYCTNPHMDCINCPRESMGGINTASSSKDLTLKAEWRPNEDQKEPE